VTERLAILEHWYPDGQQIAFSGLNPGKVWKVFLISKDGGTPQAVTANDVSERDPSWSPDGKTLAFGHVDFDHVEQTFIAVFDVKTHQISEFPGSRKLFAPRWSPDGRYLLAETVPEDKLRLYDVPNKTWHSVEVPRSINGFSYLAWSHDSAFIYFDADVSNESKYFRLRIKDLKVEPLIDVKGKITRRFPAQLGGSWSGLGPGDTPLFVRDISTQEIYALDLQLP
jgi:Tol biopolymer transport system component